MSERFRTQIRYKPRQIARASRGWVGRTRLMSHLQRAAVHLAPDGRFPKLSEFLDSRTGEWIWQYIRGLFHTRYKPYPAYAGTGDSGVYPMRPYAADGAIRVSIVGDWGTGTAESAQIAEHIRGMRPDYTLHLGDVYYVGDEIEVQENFLGTAADRFTPVAFPKGAVGTFALPGNHELYGGGKPYFTQVLGYCDTGTGHSQRASFFSLETEHWRFLGLDTGYNSVGWPVLGSLPGFDRIPRVGADCALRPELLDWLRTEVDPQRNRKATVLLSHHQAFTAFDEEFFPRPARQLAELFAGQAVVWLWGHEHRLAVYEPQAAAEGFSCHARCIGHGGMPVETGKPKPGHGLRFYDAREDYDAGDGRKTGWNGFVEATVAGRKLALDYRDLTNRLQYRESFTIGSDGVLEHAFEPPPILVAP
jgi:hypothetical protein